MRIGIIADDLTGANDSGVQLSRYGLKTSVRFNFSNEDTSSDEAVVIDTDSRSIEKEEAYRRVREAAKFLKQNQFNVIYKKIDSTLRGNLGAEVDAIYDEFQPDFVIIAPGYPKNGRKIDSGHLYLNGVLLHETEIASDPKSPVHDSYVPHVFHKQTERKIGCISNIELRNGYDSVKNKMDQFSKEDTHYLLFDSETENDLAAITKIIHETEYNVIWLGSAGLANYLPEIYDIKQKKVTKKFKKNNDPVLLVVGSVSSVTRNQLDNFLKQDQVSGVKLNATLLTLEQSWEKEVETALTAAKRAYDQGKHVAVFPTGDRVAIQEAQAQGEKIGLSKTEVSNLIVRRLGNLTDRLLDYASFKGIILTGGDTAKQVCTNIGVDGIRLLDEIETGVPIGKLIGRHSIYAITKAGAFGKEDTFSRSIKILQGVEEN